jgi:hypothetical protein
VGDLGTGGWSRAVAALAAGILVVWGLWALVFVTTGFPKLSYLSFGLISLPLGAVLAVLSLVGLAHAVQTGQRTRSALAALFLSLSVGLVPWIALLTICDHCVS